MSRYLQVNQLSLVRNGNQILDDITFQMEQGAHFGLAGSTGSGKSSLLKCIAGLMQPNSGNIFFKEKKVLGGDEQLIPGHQEIIYLSQQFELRNHYRVHELLEMAEKIDGPEVNEIAAMCRISHLLQRDTSALSGGEKQRVAIAIALIKKPQLLLLDEPFSNADTIHKQELEEILFDLRNSLSQSYILVSHDSRDLLSHTDTIIILEDGAIVQAGKPEDIYRRPVNEYAAGLMGNYTVLTPAFCAAAKIRIKQGMQLMARPDAFTIHNRQTPLQARVEQVYYMGHYALARLSAVDCVIHISYQYPQIFKGDIVYLSVDSNKIIYY